MKKAVSLLVCAFMLFSVCFAANFSDMPDDWSKASLEKAVENGLISGSDGMIFPYDNMTRAQMATIMVRALGASAKADISGFADVSPDAWYYDSMAKAVAMGAFTGDGKSLNPNANITRQETFVVLGRLFSLDIDSKIAEHFGLDYSADAVLANYSDGNDVAAWARDIVAAIISSGYVNGSGGKINPNAYITRAEFAAVIGRMVETYIDAPGTYTTLPAGNVVIRCDDVKLNGATVAGDLIVGEGAHNGAILIDSTVTGRYVARSGKANAISGGKCGSIRLLRPDVMVSAQGVTRDIVYGAEDTEFSETIDFDIGE